MVWTGPWQEVGVGDGELSLEYIVLRCLWVPGTQMPGCLDEGTGKPWTGIQMLNKECRVGI